MEQLILKTSDYSVWKADKSCLRELSSFVVTENEKHHHASKTLKETEGDIRKVYQEEVAYAGNSRIFLAKDNDGKIIGSIRVFKWDKEAELPFCIIKKASGRSPDGNKARLNDVFIREPCKGGLNQIPVRSINQGHRDRGYVHTLKHLRFAGLDGIQSLKCFYGNFIHGESSGGQAQDSLFQVCQHWHRFFHPCLCLLIKFFVCVFPRIPQYQVSRPLM